MSYRVEFSEPTFDISCNQWILVGFLHLEIEGESYRTLSVKHWLSNEARFNQRWFNSAKENIRRELEDRANRETRSVLQYRQPVQAEFTRFTIPNIRRFYPQILNDIFSIQPRSPSPVLESFYQWRHRVIEPIEKINWKKEGF